MAAYAHAWDYVLICCQGVLSGFDDSGGSGNAILEDAGALFVSSEPRLHVGMAVRNATTGTYGYITEVIDETHLRTSTTWSDGDQYKIAYFTADEIEKIEDYLALAGSDIWASLQASGQADCSKNTNALDYLRLLNVRVAAAIHNCPCGRPDMSDEQRAAWFDWADAQLRLIRTGEIELCDGHTGTTWPARATAEQALTGWRADEIVRDRELRDS